MKKLLFPLALMAMILFSEHSRAQDMQQLLGKITDMTKKAEYKPVYNFDAYMQMEISDPGANQIMYNAYLTKDGTGYAVIIAQGDGKTVIIFDAENNSVLMLTEGGGEKTGFAFAVNPDAFEALAEEIGQTDEPFENFKTGKTKSILGYSCDEYLVPQDESETRIWVSEELGKKLGKAMLNNQRLFSGAFTFASALNGMVMEYSFTDKVNEKTTSMKVTKVDLNASQKISTQGYNIMSMGQ